ncbi:DRTGG domain protein [Desulfovibrio sp. X2]|uniref:phosphotransacetylase family protein n=1 Tax=Desulfovibrio sp. X2 TaxID=941449 RepID=UPI000358B2D3|nr:phosphotransacetylase family protein [Desulfovibrio sp. X2]EPR43873.1 DRTGG domain protein [Desulfovibrio sp. X2]
MAGLYVGATAGYSGKNMIALGIGLWLQKQNLKVGYLKPVGAMPVEKNGKLGDEDAFFMQQVLGLDQDPSLVTPVLVTQDFKVKAFSGQCHDLMADVRDSYEKLSAGKDLTLVAGSGSMYSGRYCNVDGVSVVKNLGIKAIVIDRFEKELKYDYLAVMREQLGDQLLGVVLNDVPATYMDELRSMLIPFLEGAGVKVLGVIPRDPLLGAIKVTDLAERLGGKIISAHGKADRVVENFLIGTMQVENFLTHFKKHRNSAVIVGGDRSDVQLVALEGDCPCLILTGNLYPNEIILTRSEVLEIPIIIVREDTFSVAKKMETLLSRHKFRDAVKIKQGAEIVAANVDLAYIRQQLGV